MQYFEVLQDCIAHLLLLEPGALVAVDTVVVVVDTVVVDTVVVETVVDIGVYLFVTLLPGYCTLLEESGGVFAEQVEQA